MNEEDLVQRAADERAAIVAKYKHGRRDGAKIDSWEESSLAVYDAADRYGFILDKNKHSSDDRITETTHPSEIKIEREREKKWIKMLNQWERVPLDKLKRRIFKGIPNSLRGQAWKQMLEVDKVKDKQPGKYQEMKELAWKWSSEIRQIDLDVNRTYRDNVIFKDRYNSKQQELFNVLGAYSMYNSEIGYCQGMSQIAALLLMYLQEEDAFWALSTLVAGKKYNMHGFFIPGFPKLLRYQEHHDKIMQKFLPKLKKHLDKNGVDTGIYTLKWFFQCFLDRIPFRLTLRVWDVYLYLGERILTAMAYNLLNLHRKKLCSLGMDDILQFLQVHLERRFEVDDDIVMESLSKCLEELKRSKLDYAGPPTNQELPKRPFGSFKEPSFDQKVSVRPSLPLRHSLKGRSTSGKQVTEPKPMIVISDPVGRRSTEFSSVERATKDNVVLRRDTAVAAALAAGESPTEEEPSAPNGHARHSHDESIALPGSKFSLERGSMDGDGSSLLGEGSRRSLAETSITSTADLSVFSSAPRSQAADTHSVADTHSACDEDTDQEDGGGAQAPTPTPRSPDILRIFVPYDSPQLSLSLDPAISEALSSSSVTNGDIIRRPPPPHSLDNKIRIIVMDHTPPGSVPEENTPLAELASSTFSPIVDSK